MCLFLCKLSFQFKEVPPKPALPSWHPAPAFLPPSSLHIQILILLLLLLLVRAEGLPARPHIKGVALADEARHLILLPLDHIPLLDDFNG